jgi:CDP-diacylglycerol--glycerol-3-phosphate 3-phosphatidyltransferase
MDQAKFTAEPNALSAWKKKLPMRLTWARIAMSPVLIVLLSFDASVAMGYWAAIVFTIASITDWFDGALARKYKVESTLGKFMDPIADKVLVSSVLIMLLPLGRVSPVMVIILLVRDILIGGIRSVAAADGVIIDAKNTGKWKTALQMLGIPALLIHNPIFGFPTHDLGITLLWISAGLSIISGVQYTRAYFLAKRA